MRIDGLDDGGELVHDGWPTTPAGMVDASQLSEEAKEAAGFMGRPQRIEHAALRRMNDDAGKVEILDATPADDPWLTPSEAAEGEAAQAEPAQRQASRPSKTAVDKLTSMCLQLGEPADAAAFLAWQTGREVAAAEELSRGEVSMVTSFIDDALQAAKGDTAEAVSRIWGLYRKATGAEAPAGA